VDKPSDQVRNGPYVYPKGPYSHIQEAKGRPETMMWVFERPDGGRGFGFTGGHKHVNWANENQRKVLLNALLWISRVEVPAQGVASKVAPEELEQNFDLKGAPADATNITGDWTATVETPDGPRMPAFTIVHAGQNLIGHYKGSLGEAEISGSVNPKSGEVKWSFEVEFDGERRTCAYQGKIESNHAMKGAVTLGEWESRWTAKR